MEHPPVDFDDITEPLETRVATGLEKVSTALRSQAWRGAGQDGLTPTQGRLLALLLDEDAGVRLATLAEALGVSGPTTSDALGALIAKGHVERGSDLMDRRAAAFRLTDAGRAAAERSASWPDFLVDAVNTLAPDEKAQVYGALIKIIRSIQDAGAVSVQRMCVTCRFFQPNVRPDDPERPHVCGLVGAPFGDGHLRLECREHEQADDALREDLWRRYTARPGAFAT
ncbi:MAG: MarR family winged helix-turn-helix transcriptional regulator [Brevundimonas sp.]|nr:MarR family winged helix-turn-helix transcriptional regulator [Brevundimonas sp.]